MAEDASTECTLCRPYVGRSGRDVSVAVGARQRARRTFRDAHDFAFPGARFRWPKTGTSAARHAARGTACLSECAQAELAGRSDERRHAFRAQPFARELAAIRRTGSY